MIFGLETSEISNLGMGAVVVLLVLKEVGNILKSSKNKNSKEQIKSSDAPEFWLLQKSIEQGIQRLIVIEDQEAQLLSNLVKSIEINTEYLKKMTKNENYRS